MKHTPLRVLAATALVCGLASQAWAQAATAALPAIPDLAPLSVPVDSAATHHSWASGRGVAAGELGRRLDAQGSELGLQVAHLREQVGQLREGLPEGLREAIAGARSLAAAAACRRRHDAEVRTRVTGRCLPGQLAAPHRSVR